MPSNSTLLWHNFLIYLPVILILVMISTIYVTYLFSYIVILLNAENQIPANFLLRHTSSYNNAKTKGIILLIITLIFVLLLLVSIMKTVITDPGYFPEPSYMEYKMSTSISDKNSKENDKPNFNLLKSKKSNEENKDNLINYEDLESEIISEEKEKNNGNKFDSNTDESLEKSKINESSNYAKLHKSQSLFLKVNTNQDYENSKLTFNNFTKSVKEFPINYTEYVNLKKEIDTYYNQKKMDINHEGNFQKKNNDEIIETNKINLMEYKNECTNHKKTFYFDLSNLYKKTDISKMNQCGTCQRIKIERSHHCKMCQRCVLKMDHHCPWLANCIGFYNYKYFCLTHFYGTISTGLIFITYWETVVNVNLSYNSTLLECWFVTFIFLMNLSLMMFLIWLLTVNTKLVFNGETIIEQSDRERFPSTKSFNIYDMGWKRNYINVFGDRWYKWLIPGFTNMKGNGLFYETKKNFYFEKENTLQLKI